MMIMMTSYTTMWTYIPPSLPCRPQVEVGRTEVVRDNCNPDFTAQVIVTYFFEEQQTITLKVEW